MSPTCTAVQAPAPAVLTPRSESTLANPDSARGKRISGLPTGCVRRTLAYQLHKLRHEVGKKKREDRGQDDGKR